MNVLPERKSSEKKSAPQQKKEIAMPEKKEKTIPAVRQKPTGLAPYRPLDLWRDFDRTFERFRRDFEDLLVPSRGSLARAFSMMPQMEIRVPHVDLEDRGKDFLLTAEMPGFKKDDVEIHVQDNSVEIRGAAGWKYEDKTKTYICRERECESYYRMVELPDEIKTDAVEANLKDGVLEVVLPKKTPNKRKKSP